MYKSAILLVALMAPGVVLSQTLPAAPPAPPPSPVAQPVPSAAPVPVKRNPFSSKAAAPAPMAAPMPQPLLPPPPLLPLPGPQPKPSNSGIKLGALDDGRVYVGLVGDKVLYRTKDDSYVLEPHKAH